MPRRITSTSPGAASAEGKNGGQFYTPSCVVRLLVEMLAPRAKSRIYDPCCGSAGMFVQSEKFIEAHGGQRDQVAIYGQESNATTRRLGVMNLAIRGFSADLGHEHADTLRRDLHPDLRAGCAEKAGSGTTDMIDACRAAGVPEPDFHQRGPHFVDKRWRDWLTDEVLAGLGLNERQLLAVAFLKTNRRISNPEYQALAETTKKTATRDLMDLKEKGLVEQRGRRGPGVHCILAGKRDKKET